MTRALFGMLWLVVAIGTGGPVSTDHRADSPRGAASTHRPARVASAPARTPLNLAQPRICGELLDQQACEEEDPSDDDPIGSGSTLPHFQGDLTLASSTVPIRSTRKVFRAPARTLVLRC